MSLIHLVWAAAESGDGRRVVFDEWNENISGIHIPGDNWYTGDYRVYDEKNNIIGELHY